MQSLGIYKKRFEHYSTQIKALAKLQKNSEPIFISLGAVSLANVVVAIADTYVAEFKVSNYIFLKKNIFFSLF